MSILNQLERNQIDFDLYFEGPTTIVDATFYYPVLFSFPSITLTLLPFLYSPFSHFIFTLLVPSSNHFQTNNQSISLLIKNNLLMLGSTPRNRRQPNHRLLKTTNTVILLIDFLSLTTLLHAHL